MAIVKHFLVIEGKGSFSVFVEPISCQRIFHLVSVFYITAHLAKS